MSIIKTTGIKHLSFIFVLFLFNLLLFGCSETSGDGSDDKSEEIVFKLQEYPVNSKLHVYEDSVRLKEAMASFQPKGETLPILAE
jgi:hypothetical protein